MKRKVALPRRKYYKSYITTGYESCGNVAGNLAIFDLYAVLGDVGPNVDASIINNFTLKIIGNTCVIRRPDEFRTKFVYKSSNERLFKVIKHKK